VERITERRDQMIQDATFNCLTEVLKIRLAKDKTLSEAARKDQERKLQFLENLKSFSDYKDWALSHKDDWEMMDEGFRQTLEFLPLDENPELSISVHSAEALVDGTYDVADFYAKPAPKEGELEKAKVHSRDACARPGGSFKQTLCWSAFIPTPAGLM
jgi:hypothetical protein